MSLRFATRTALCLAIFALLGARAAHADSSYLPYYMQSEPQPHLFAQVPPARYAGVQEPAAPATPVAAPEQPEDWQSSNPLFHFNNEVWASAGASLFNYKEAVKPLPDSEVGDLPSLAAGASYMTHENLYLSLDGSVSFGNAHYNGAYLASPSTPLESTTHETIASVNGKVGQGFFLSGNTMLIPYVDIGYRYWDRNLGSGQGEFYQNYDTLGGLMFQYTPVDRLLLSVYGSVGTTFGASMKTSGNTYDLGGSAIEKVGGKIGYDLTRKVELFTTLDYDHFHYGKSPVFASVYEPGSRTEDTTMRVGIGYHFR